VRYAGFVAILAGAVGALVWAGYGGAHAGALLYGVAVGLLSFVSTALTVSLLTASRSKAGGMMIGATSFVARYGFAACALGVPMYLGLWPVAAMVLGFAGVYLAENVMLLPVLLLPGILGGLNAERSVERSVREKEERRVVT